MCVELDRFADSLQDSYRDTEESYPVLRVDNAILERIRGTALSYLDSAQKRVGGIKLYPIRELRNRKRPRPEGE